MAIVTENQTQKFVVGEFAYGSWGYDQTNIDFYLVVRKTEKTIWLQPVKSEIVEMTNHLAEYVAPTTTPKQDLIWKERTSEMRSGDTLTVREYEMVDTPVEKYRIKSWDDGTEFISPRFGLIYPYDNKPKFASHTH
jgi:hypothetical protein